VSASEEVASTKFDQTVTLLRKLGFAPPATIDQWFAVPVRSPHGSGKDRPMLVFATANAARRPKEAGANLSFRRPGETVPAGFQRLDVAIAYPAASRKCENLARSWSPGVNAESKTGTGTYDKARTRSAK